MADHLAFAARRERENIFLSNPFIPDIKILFGKEYAVALESRSIIEEMTGYRISDDEAGFIALHIHSGLSDEAVSETLKATQLIDESMQIIEEHLEKEMQKEALNYIRLMSHLYYMVVRTKTGEAVNIDLNEFVQEKYPEAMKIAALICDNIGRKHGKADHAGRGWISCHSYPEDDRSLRNRLFVKKEDDRIFMNYSIFIERNLSRRREIVK